MKTPRSNRSPEPEILIRLALHLLELAGAELLAWHTVAEVAAAVELDKESVRLAIRRGQLHAIWSGRLLQYFIPHSALCRFCESRGVPVPGFVGAQGSVALLPESTMINDPNRPLSPLERSQLDHLLDKLGGGRVEAMAQTAEAAAAERCKLEREQEKLARQEAAAAQKLADIRSDIDRVTSELMSRAKQHRQGGSLAARVEQLSTALRAAIERDPGVIKPSEIETLLRSCFDSDVDNLYAPKCKTCGHVLTGQAAYFAHMQELAGAADSPLAGEEQARRQADEIIRTGEKWNSGVFRDDALPPTNKRGRRQ
jgi:hypothetical protein